MPPFRWTTSPPSAAPLVSPLRQVNLDIDPFFLRSNTKFASSWAQLTTNPTLFFGQNPVLIGRFFNDLFCLKVYENVLKDAIESLETKQLLGPYKNNITQLFIHAVKTLKEAEKEDTRRDNVIETLIPFLRNLLSRTYENFSFEVMTMLAGSLERSDSIFTDLVSSIDLILQDTSYETELRHRTLQLALVIVASVNQGSINAFFLRRDLFSTLVKFMSDPATSPFAFESALLLGLLANFRKYEARNPYLVRIEDFVEENVMRKIIQVTASTLSFTRNTYTSITDDQPASFVASLTSLIFSLRLSDLFSSASFSLPPPPERSNSSRKGKGKEIETPPPEVETAGLPERILATSKKNGVVEGAHELERPALPSRQGSDSKKAEEKEKEGAFAAMPPEMVVILLPFYDLLNSNTAFGALVFAGEDDAPSPLPPALISLSSYIFCHAAVSRRARAYARLCLVILIILVEESDGRLSGDAESIRLCRQRQPMLAYNNERRPPIAAMLDTAVIFLRHNLHRKLDAETYIVCLKLIQRIMQQLKTERVRLNYDWVSLWRPILALSAFIVSKIEDLRLANDCMNDLISQIFIVLSYAEYWGDSFLPSTTASVLLHYELLHADSVLDQLGDLLGLPVVADSGISSPRLQPPTPNRSTFFSTSPRRTHFGLGMLARDGPPSLFAAECVTNVRQSIAFFSSAIDDTVRLAAPKPDEVDAEQVMSAIAGKLGELELIDAAAMADARSYTESSQEAFFRSFSEVACADVVKLIP